jgi:ABC-2 type transport system permease protein
MSMNTNPRAAAYSPIRRALLPKWLKYQAVGRISLNNQLAYVADFFVRSIFLTVIMYIFMQLWTTTYQGEGTPTIAGYTIQQIIWYILFAEALTMAFPSLSTRIEEEVKSGDVGYKLTRPLHYIGYHYAAYLAEVYVKLGVNLLMGCLIGTALVGFPSIGLGWAGLLLMSFGAITVHFTLSMTLALCAFWVEETRGLEFVYHKLLFTIGGMLMPLELFPETLQTICRWLPFQTIMYFPSKTAVRYEDVNLLPMLLTQAAWIVILGIVVLSVYRLGVRKLNVNGG